MEQPNEFAALRNLLALKRLETPMEPATDRFLIELHRRQRAGLLEPSSSWARFSAWLGEKAAGLSFGSALSYGSAFAAIALVSFVSLQPQMPTAQADGGQFKLSVNLPARDSSSAMLPVSFTTAMSAPKAADVSFAAGRSAATRFVLTKPILAYDANAF